MTPNTQHKTVQVSSVTLVATFKVLDADGDECMAPVSLQQHTVPYAEFKKLVNPNLSVGTGADGSPATLEFARAELQRLVNEQPGTFPLAAGAPQPENRQKRRAQARKAKATKPKVKVTAKRVPAKA